MNGRRSAGQNFIDTDRIAKQPVVTQLRGDLLGRPGVGTTAVDLPTDNVVDHRINRLETASGCAVSA